MLVEILAMDKDYKLVGQCGEGQEALQMCLDLKPDLVVLDAKLPGLNGVELLRRLTKRVPDVGFLSFPATRTPSSCAR